MGFTATAVYFDRRAKMEHDPEAASPAASKPFRFRLIEAIRLAAVEDRCRRRDAMPADARSALGEQNSILEEATSGQFPALRDCPGTGSGWSRAAGPPDPLSTDTLF